MKKYRVLVVGAGVSGLFVAYSLVKRGEQSVAILEKSFPGAGSTGRCATGVRASFSSEEHVVLMKKSIELWLDYSKGELGKYGLCFAQTGYVWLVSSEKSLKFFEELSKFHNSLGVPTRVLSPDEVKKFVPPIDEKKVLGALYDPTAGKAHPFDTVCALVLALKKHGVKILTGVDAQRIMAKDSYVKGVETSEGTVECDYLVVAAGAESKDLLASIGVKLPLKNMPRHVLVTEAYKPAFNPLVIDWDTPGVPYIVQTKDGNFFIGREIEEEENMPLVSQRIDFMPKAVTAIARLFPWITKLRILRYWLGYYVVSPDNHPIYGPVEDYENLYLAVGFSGHGYMMGPITGEIIANWIIEGRPKISQAERLTLKRIKEGKLIRERAIVG